MNTIEDLISYGIDKCTADRMIADYKNALEQ